MIEVFCFDNVVIKSHNYHDIVMIGFIKLSIFKISTTNKNTQIASIISIFKDFEVFFIYDCISRHTKKF